MKTKPTLFLAMFSVVTLINVNFAILRSLRNTIVVTDLAGSALYIPLFELCGTLPGTVLMSWILGRLLTNMSLHRTFLFTMSAFILFFILFGFVLYPLLKSGDGSFEGISIAVSMVFYVVAELWKVALLTVLFWGFINAHTSLDEAKRIYAPLMLAGSGGTILAGPITSSCSSATEWTIAVQHLLLVVVFLGSITAAIFFFVRRHFMDTSVPQSADVTLSTSLRTCARSPQLRLMAGIIIADYVAYSVGEVIFLDVLKQRFPRPQDYCVWMGYLSLWSGILTGIGTLWIAPKVLRNCSWVAAALVTPICVLAAEGAFFLALRLPDINPSADWIQIAVCLGSLQYCLCRAAKYALFDSTRELAFLMLPDVDRLQGKLVVDGVCGRLGRGTGAFLSLGLCYAFGGLLASAWAAGCVALVVSGAWIEATRQLGALFKPKIGEA